MIKLRLYNTPNRLPYVGCDYNKKYGWFSIHALGKAITAYWGKNTHLIP